METRPPAKGTATLILTALLLARMAGAQTLYWDPGAGATWDTVTLNWSTTSSGSANATWTNGDTADFSDSAGPSGSYTVTLNGTQTAAGLTFATGTATLTSGTLALIGSGQVSVSAVEGIIASPITGSVGLTKIGGGQLDLSGPNTFTGNITNRAGILTLDNNLAGGEGVIALNPSASVTLNSSLAVITLTNNVEILGSSSTAEIDAGANNRIVLGGVVSGPHNWNANGLGMLVLSNANTFGGILTVEQGTVAATMNGSLGGTGNDVIVSNNATLAFQGTFTYTDNKVVLLNGSGAGGGPALEGIGGDSIFYGPVILAANSEIGTSAGSLELVEPITGPYNLVTAGEVAFGSSGNTYNNTLVNQGDLYIENGSSAGTGQVTVNPGATFEGVSSVAAPGGVSLSGTISPGAGEPGSLGTASETWQGGASYDWTLGDATNSAGVGYSTLNINGGLTILAGSSQRFTIYISSFSPDFDISGPPDNFDNTREYDWTIASATGGISGFNASAFRIDSTGFDAPLGGGSFRVFDSGNNLILEFDPAPIISCPGSIIATNDPNECSATVSFAAVATNYLNLEPVSIAYETNGIQIHSPCVFPKGTNIVTSIATDGVGDTATCSFTVTVNDTQAPTIGTCATNQTIAANAVTAKGTLPDITGELAASDNCGGPLTYIQIPPAGTSVGLGATPVTVWAIDQSGNSNSCTATITVIYTNPPVLISCAPSVTVSVTQDKEPYATGYPTFSDPDEPLTITYSDDVSGLTGHDVTGTIVRTWTAEDASSNMNTCIQTITVVDTNAPYFTYVPADITTTNIPNVCGANVSFGGAAQDLGYFQGFENSNWACNTNPANTDWDWNSFNNLVGVGGLSTMYRAASGNNGIVSPNGVAYAIIDSSASASLNYNSNGVFTLFNSGQTVGAGAMPFDSGYEVSLDIYINTNDPEVINSTPTNGYGFDVDTASRTLSGGSAPYGRDFIFHVAAYGPTDIVVAADNNSSNSGTNRPTDLITDYPDHAILTNGGWYKFDWDFRNSNGVLAVDLTVRDSSGATAFSQTLSDASDTITSIAGNPFYLWFNFIDDNQLPITDVAYQRVIPVDSTIASGAQFPVGTTTVTNTAMDDSGNSTNATFTVMVNDVEPPSANVPSNIITNNFLSGECGANVFFTLPAQSDNCGISNEVATPASGSFFPVGPTPVTVVVTDVHGNTATNSFMVTVNDTALPTVSCPGSQTNGANAGTATVALPDLTTHVTASDPCPGALTLVQIPPAGTTVGLGTTEVTVWAIDQNQNSNSCSTAITVIYTNPPVLVSCAPEVTVTTTQDKNPYATGYPVFTDPDIPLTTTYSDNYTNLTGCDSTGFILRTWTAMDASGNVNTCLQRINVIDTNAPDITYVPAPIATNNTPGQCGAFVTFGGAAEDLGYIQNFENPNWIVSTNPPGSTLDWDDFSSAVYRVPSGNNGIASPNGVAYAVIDSTVPQAGANYSSSGAFTLLGGLSSWQFENIYGYNGISSPFGLGYRVSQEVYINLQDPAVTGATPTTGYGWDLSTGASDNRGNFLQDFVFHTAAYNGSGVVVAADNQSNDNPDARRNDLLTTNHTVLTSSGWYKFEWNFYGNGDGTLSVDMKVRDTNGVVYFDQNVTNGTPIAQVDGHPNYTWFIFVFDNQLPIADTVFERNEPVTPSIASGTLFPIGITTVTDTTADACLNSTNTTFTVTVHDVQPPTLELTNAVTVKLDASGNYVLSPSDVAALVAGSSAICQLASTNVSQTSFSCGNVGANTVMVTLTDVNSVSTTASATITVQDLNPPTLVLNPITVALDPSGNYTLTGSDIARLLAGSDDACSLSGGLSSTNISQTSFSCSDVGSKTVTVILTDSNGNSTMNTSTITVQDTTPPTLELTNAVTVTLGSDGTYTLSAIDEANIVAGSFDSCGIQSTTYNPTTFTYCQTGSVPVVVTMTDIHGNSSTGSASVTINAPTNPPALVYVDATYGNECNVKFPNNDGSGSYYYGYNAFNTIQGGLNAVATNGTVTVAPGTYNEDLNIAKAVNLISLGGSNVTTINLQTHGSIYSDTILVNASSVLMQGFTVVGFNATVGIDQDLASDNLYLDPGVTNIEISDNVIEVGNISTNPISQSNQDGGHGIITQSSTSPVADDINIFNNVIELLPTNSESAEGAEAFYINPTVLNFTFASNTITGNFAPALSQANNALIEDNLVIGTGTNSGSGGFGTWGYPDATMYGHAIFADNDITNTQYAITLYDSEDVTIENNLLDGNGTAVSLQDYAQQNVDSNFTYDQGTSVQIISNSIANCVTGVDNETVTGNPNASSNWWGSVSGPASAQNPYGTGSPVTGTVTVGSWLATDANANTGIGFTPGAGEDYPPTQLVFTTEPGGANLGSLLSPEPEVTVEDANGHTTPWVNAIISITISNNPAFGMLVGTTNEPSVSGMATFTDLYVTNDGGSGYTLAASAPGLPSAESGQFDVANPAPQIVSLTPFYTTAGASGFSLTVTGNNFVANSAVEWNEAPLATSYVSSTELTATVPASDLTTAGPVVVTVVSPGPGGGTSSGTFYVEPAKPSVVYVDMNYAHLAANSWVNWPYGGTGTNIVGYDAFATIQEGVNAVAPGGTVNVAAGTYVEEVTISQPLALLGPNAAICPNTGTRVPEAVIEPDISDPEIYDSTAVVIVSTETNDITIKGFTIDGYNPDLTGADQSGLDLFNAAVGIGDYTGDNSLKIENNIVENDSYAGVDLESDHNGSSPNTNSDIECNLIKNMDYNAEGYGIGITLYNNYYAQISGNCLTNVAIGISPQSYWLANPGNQCGQTITNNQIYASLLGIWLNLDYGSASTFEIVGNTSTFISTNGSALYGPPEWDAYEVTSVQTAAGVFASNNVAVGPSGSVGYNTAGYNIWNTPTTSPVLITGGSVSNVSYGIWVNNYDGYQSPATNNPGALYPATAATVANVSITGALLAGVYVQDDPRASALGVAQAVQATVTGNTVITDSGIGVLVQGTNAAATVINNDASISSNGIGILVDTGKALVENNDLTGNGMAGISVINSAIVDAGDCSGNDVTGLGTGSGDHGSSKGLNNLSGYGFDSVAPWSIENFNTGGGMILAENDNFGVTNSSQNIASEIDNPNGVAYSQGPALIVTPANDTVVCASDVPPGATSLGEFTTEGGYYSGNNASVSFNDSDSTNITGGTNIITILRVYTIGDLCNPLTATQTITLNETPPVVNVPANITVTNDPGVCGATVAFTVPPAGDNCTIVNQTQTSPSGALFPVGTTTVSVMATDNNGLSTTNSFTVTVIDGEPPAIINAVNIVRAVDPGQIYATVGFSINATDNCSVASIAANWQANTQSASGNTVAVSGWQFPIGTNTVTVTATDVNSNATTASFTVAVIGLPQITSQPQSQTNNEGTTATFMVAASSPATLTYQWYKGNNPLSVQGNISDATSATLSITTVSNLDAATYYVVVSNFAGTVTSSNATLTVIDPPAITTITPSSQTNDASTTAQFTVTAAGTSPFAYQWSKITATSTNVLSDSGNIFGSASNVLTISNLLAADQAEYVVTISNSAGTDTTNALLFVNDPAILVQPSDITNRLGSSVIFSVTAAGSAPLSYQWQQDGFDLPGATGSTLMLNNINDSSAGNYTVVVSNHVNQVVSDIATLTVTHPPVITAQPGNTTVNLGQNATFNVAVNGDTPFTYQWYQNGSAVSAGNVSGGTTRQLTITGATTSNAGTYYVAITNAIGGTISSNATLTVIVPPAITNQPVGLTTNAGSTVTFTVNASGTAPAFQWYQITPTVTNVLTDGGNVFGSTSNVLTITNVLGANDGNYIAVASNHAGTNVSSSAALLVIDPIITNEPSSVTANLGSPANFTVGAYGTSPNYQWYQNGHGIAGANASTYSIASVLDANAGNYTVVVSNIFGVVTSTPAASLTVIDPPVITSQPRNVTANAGATAVFAVTNTGTSPTYQWYFGNQPLANSVTVTGANGPVLTLTDVQDANVGTYSVVLSNEITTVTSSNAALTVIDPPVIASLQPSSQTNNATTTAQFTVNVTGTAPFTYQWTKITAALTNVLSDVGNISGSTSNVLTITNILAADQAEYLVTVSNPAGTVTTNGTLVVVDPAIFTQPAGQTNFLGSTVTFSVTAAGTSPLKYQWLQNGSPLFGANTNILTLQDLADSDAGTYTVIITNAVGSVTSAPAVLVTVSPLITQQPANVVTLVGLSTSFSVNVNGELPFSYQWQFNGTNIAGATNRVYTIASVQLSNAGEYDVVVQNPVGTQVSRNASLFIGTAALLSTPPNNGLFTFMVTGVPGYLYTIQGSTNLIIWFPITTNTAPFTFTNNSGYPYEFYRALYQQ